jgi:hypothetical protein
LVRAPQLYAWQFISNYIEDAESAADTLAILAEEKYKIGFFGHTHQPKVFSEDDTKTIAEADAFLVDLGWIKK